MKLPSTIGSGIGGGSPSIANRDISRVVARPSGVYEGLSEPGGLSLSALRFASMRKAVRPHRRKRSRQRFRLESLPINVFEAAIRIAMRPHVAFPRH